MSPSKMSVRILLSILIVCMAVAHGQLLNRRQPFNLLRQQNQLETRQDAAERQPTGQLREDEVNNNPPVNRATFERLFEAIRMINELFQTLSAIRARFTSDPSTPQATSIPAYLNGQ